MIEKRKYIRSLRHLVMLLILFVPVISILLAHRSNAVSAAEPASFAASFVEFSAATYSTVEGNGTKLIDVTLNPAEVTTVTVQYATSDNTATVNNDYLAASGTLVFAPGQTALSFSITIIDDSTVESIEDIDLTLSNPVNASFGANDTATLSISDNDVNIGATQTVLANSMTSVAGTSTAQAATPSNTIYMDAYEPNDDFYNAYTIAVGSEVCSITLWPAGEKDFFRFIGKGDKAYKISITQMDDGLDTILTAYDSNGNYLASNDDLSSTSRRSEIERIVPGYNGYYYAEVGNKSLSDPAGETYCLRVTEVTPPTPSPTPTRVPIDNCRNNLEQDNDAIHTAFLLGLNQTESCDFAPPYGFGPDLDYFRVWVKPFVQYTCLANPANSWTDPSIVLYNQGVGEVARNDDKALGERAAEAQFIPDYTGWMYVLVYPPVTPEYQLSNQYDYTIKCTEALPTATPTPSNTPTWVPSSGGGSGGGSFSTPTPMPTFAFPTPLPTPTPYTPPPPATATPRANVIIQPLPTTFSPTAVPQSQNVRLQVYYDLNRNFQPELTEGVTELAVAVYDKNSGRLLAFGYTNEAGEIPFSSVMTSGAVRVSIPYLNFTQIVTLADEQIVVRIAPRPLPMAIP